MAPKSKKNAYNMQYSKENTRQIKFSFSLQYDADILEKLDSVPNKQGYIKSLIRADIARSAQNKEEKEMKKWYIVKAVHAQNLKDADHDGCIRTAIGTFEASADLTWREIIEHVSDYCVDAENLGKEYDPFSGAYKLRLPESKPSWHYEITDVPHKFRYQVEYTDPTTGATSPIDTITAKEGYTAANYIADCDRNADEDWCKMLHAGSVTLEPIED